MKRTRVMIAVMLLAALLVSGCALAMAAEEEAVPEEEAQAQLADPYPFQDFPAKAPQQQAAGGQVTQTKMQTDLFKAKFEGDTVSGSGGAVGGKFHFIATETDGESWHVKLEANYPTISGRDYAVTYNFTSDVAGTVKFGDFQEFQIQEGENSVTGTFTAKDSTSYLDLQLGMLPAFTIDFTDIQVKEYADEVTYENALPAPVNFQRESRVYERHDTGYDTVLVRGDNAININYETIPMDLGVWKSRLYVRTGLVPKQGTHYRVTADVMVDRYERNIPFEVLLNDGDIEKGYGALYGQQLVPGEVKTCEAVITGNGNGDELILQFSLGEARGGSLIIVGNVHVDKIIDQYTNVLPEGFALDQSVVTGAIIDEPVPVAYENIPLSPAFYSGVDSVYEQHDDGYVVDLKEGSSSATMAITQAPSNPDDRGVWKAKLFAATGVTLKPGRNYRLQFDLDSEGNQADYEICFDGDVENAYGALYGRSLTAGGTDHVDIILNPEKSNGPLTVRFQLGKTDTASGNTVTLRNFSLEAVELEYTNVLPNQFSYRTSTSDPEDKYVSILPDSFTYDTDVNVSEDHADGYTQSVSDDGKSATLTITSAPQDGRAVWNSKLLINTGVALKAGERYVVSFDVTGKKDQASYEICFDGASENSYGALYGRSLSAGVKQGINYTVTPEKSDGPLVIRFQLGATNDTSGNVITVSNLKVRTAKATATSVGDIEYGTDVNVWEERGDGIEQSVSTTDTTAALKITKGRSGGGVWSSRLFVNTGVTPEAGKRYRVTTTVASEKALPFEVVYDNGGAEDGYKAKKTGLSVDAGGTTTVTSEFTAPESGCEELVLRFQLGNSPADNTITVSDIQVCKLEVDDTTPISLPDFAYPEGKEGSTEKNSFDLEVDPRDGAEAELTGNETSATAKVIKHGEDWHVKLYAKPGLALEAGTKYTITMNVSGANGCTACYKRLGGEETDYGTETINGDGIVTHTVTPTQAGTLEILLKIGNVADGTEVKVSEVRIMKETTDFIPMEAAIVYPVTGEPTTVHVDDKYEEQGVSVSASAVAWAGSAATAEVDGSTATLNVTKAPDSGGVWNTRLEANTGVTLEQGATYRVSGTLKSEKPLDFEVLYSNGDGTDEGAHNPGGQGYAEGSWGLKVEAENGSCDFGKTFTVPERSEYRPLVLRIQVGDGPAPNKISVSGITVEKLVEPAHDETVPGDTKPSSFDVGAEHGATAELTGNGTSATATVTKPGDGWHVKFYAKPGIEFKAGEKYQVTMDVTGADGRQVCFKNIGTGNEEGFGTATISNGTVTHEVTAEADGTMEILLKIGDMPEGSQVTISNIKIAKYGFGDLDVTPKSFAYPVTTESTLEKNSFDLEANDGAEAVLSGDGESATATVVTPGKDYYVKFYAKPGLTLEAGKVYQISMDVSGASGCTACYKNTTTGNEEGFGKESISDGTVTHVVSPSESGKLEILLKIGEVEPGAVITVSNVQIAEVTETAGDNLMTDTLVAWPPVNFWAHEDYEATLIGENTAAKLTVTKAPETGRESWKTKLFFNTGMTLKAGKAYRISADVQSTEQLAYEICYNDAAVEQSEAALGKKDGLTATNTPETVVFETTPEGDASLVLQFNLGNATTGTAVTVSNVKVEELSETMGENLMKDALSAWAPVHSWADGPYKTSITNNDSSATLSFVSVPGGGADWQTKLFVETGAELKAGKSYRITYKIKANKPFDYHAFYNNGAEEKAVGELWNQKAETAQKTVQHVVSPSKDAVLTIQLMLGMSPAPNNVTISGVQVEEIVGAGSAAAHPPINFWANEDYAASLSNTKDSASIAITKAPETGREPWKVKLFAETKAKLEAGKTYRISVDVNATNSMDYEICYNNAGSEAELGSKWGLQAGTSKKTVTYTTTPGQDADLTLQFNLGNATAGTTFTISNVKVEEVTYASATNAIPGFRYNNVGYLSKASDPDYITSLDKRGSSADFHIWQAPAERHAWCAKVVVRTGINPTPGMGYRISFNLDADSEQNLFELFCDGNEELAYGALYEKHLDAGSNFITFTTPPVESKGPLTLQLRFGETNSTSGNHYHISDFTIEEVTFVQGRVEVKEAVENDTQDGYAAELTRTPDKATLRLVQTPTEGLEAWKNKLFVYTGAVLEPGQKYRISFVTKSIIPTPFEICFNNHNEEKGLGGIFGLTAVPTGYYTEYYPNVKENTPLVIQLSLGNCTTPNTIFLSDVKVEKAGKVNLVSDTIYSF